MSELIFSDHLRRLMKEQDVTQAQLAAVAGVSQSGVSNYLKGAIPAGDVLLRISKHLGVTVEFMLTGKTTAERARTASVAVVDRHGAEPYSVTSHLVPIISWASAGAAHAYEDQGYDVPLIASTCRDPNCYALTVEGDSMEHLYSAGDILVVLTKDEARNGDLVVVKLLDDTVYFKELRYTPDGKGVRLHSLNPKYHVLDFKRKECRFIHPVHSVTRVFKKNFGFTVHREHEKEE